MHHQLTCKMLAMRLHYLEASLWKAGEKDPDWVKRGKDGRFGSATQGSSPVKTLQKDLKQLKDDLEKKPLATVNRELKQAQERYAEFAKNNPNKDKLAKAALAVAGIAAWSLVSKKKAVAQFTKDSNATAALFNKAKLKSNPNLEEAYAHLPKSFGDELAKFEDSVKNNPFETLAMYAKDGKNLLTKAGTATSVSFTDELEDLVGTSMKNIEKIFKDLAVAEAIKDEAGYQGALKKLEEIRANSRLKGGVLAHNHPSFKGNNTLAFTPQDIHAAALLGVEEVRAVTVREIFSLKIEKDMPVETILKMGNFHRIESERRALIIGSKHKAELIDTYGFYGAMKEDRTRFLKEDVTADAVLESMRALERDMAGRVEFKRTPLYDGDDKLHEIIPGVRPAA